VGRERELADAAALWRKAVAGEGGVLLISGEPGIGKTRLVQEIATRAEVSGGRVLAGECFAEGGAPYTPVAQIIRAALTDGLNLNLPDLVVADLITIAPDLRTRYPDVPPNPPLDPAAEQQRLFESVVAFCNAVTDQAPLLLFLDDVHWADSGTLYLLRHLARRMSRRRSLIVAGYREVELGGSRPFHDVLLDLNRARLANRLKLSRLDRKQTHDLLAALFAEEITPEFLDGIYRETEGNPFFIEEVVRELVESGKLYFQDGRWVRPSMEELEIPQSVRVAIQARVANLPEEAQKALQLAAILGREFDFETLAETSESDEDALIDALECARDAQLIEDLESRGGEWFSFVHALVPAALRENLSGLRRGRLHRRAASAIEKLRPEDYEALAYHYGETGDETRALVYIIQAADRALATYANHDAENHYRAALEIVEMTTPQAEEGAPLLYGLGEALFRQGRSEEALHTWREAIALYQSLGDDDRVARLYARSARAAWWNAGDAPRGLALAREGLAAVEGMPDTVGLAALIHETGRACHFNMLPDEAIPYCQRALEMAKRLNDVELQAEILATLGLAYAGARQFDASIAALTKAVKLAESAGLISSAGRAHHNLGGRLVYSMGDLQAGRDHLLRGVEFDQRAGTPTIQFYSLSITTLPFFFLGDFVAVEKMLPRLRQLLETVADPESYQLWLRTVEALLLRYRGDLSRSVQILTACHEEARQQSNIPWRFYVAPTVAKTLLELGQWQEAQLVLTHFIEVYDWLPGGATARCLLSTVAVHQGRTADAHRLLAEVQRFERQLTPFEEENLRLAEARMATAEGRWPEAVTAFESAADIQDRIGKRWYRAQTLREWAEAHAARNEPSDLDRARELLREAQAEFEALNVPRYAAQVSERLRAL
jgi:tetratricopeptide (TPR) repeat protein